MRASHAYGLRRERQAIGDVHGTSPCPLLVELGELLGGERPAQAAAQLGLDAGWVARSSAGRWSGGLSASRRKPSCHCSTAVSNDTPLRLATLRQGRRTT